jgi:hypothetical protein
MDEVKAEQIIRELQHITRTIYTGEVPDLKPSATLLIKSIKPADTPFIRKDAAGRALYYIIEGKAGVDVGQPEHIPVGAKKTVGEMSMVSSLLNIFDNLNTVDSRTADVYADEPLRLMVFNYSPLMEILQDSNPAFRKYRNQVLISLNRIMYRKLTEVNKNYLDILVQYGLEGSDNEGPQYPLQLIDGLSKFLKNMRTIPNMHIAPHEMRGILIQQGQPNPFIILLEQGKLKVSMFIQPPEEDQGQEEEKSEPQQVALDILNAPTIIGEASILNVGSISGAQVESIGKTVGYRMQVQNLLRHLQRYPDMFENFFKLLLELNYFRTVRMMQKTTSL